MLMFFGNALTVSTDLMWWKDVVVVNVWGAHAKVDCSIPATALKLSEVDDLFYAGDFTAWGKWFCKGRLRQGFEARYGNPTESSLSKVRLESAVKAV